MSNAIPFPDSGYRLIYADPPWEYRDKANAGQRGACHKYDVMSAADIAALPVADIAAEDCVLAMWWVPPQPAEALALVEAWGFNLITMFGFVWVKKTKTGLDHFGMGHWSRANAEACLLAKRGKPKAQSHSVRQLVRAPIREHSRKPDEVADRLVTLVGAVKRIELFARRASNPAWDYWGNEL